jgi:hypothetical protein
MRTSVLHIDLDTGAARMLEDDKLDLTEALGQAVRRRASHILPLHPLKRVWFRLVRRVCGESGRAAEWTRRWRGPWQVWVPLQDHGRHVRFMPLFNHASRRVCVDWERGYFNALNGDL